MISMHYPSILVIFFGGGGRGGTTEHFSGENEAFWWDFKSIMYKSLPNQNTSSGDKHCGLKHFYINMICIFKNDRDR